jgi:hypothetical protein
MEDPASPRIFTLRGYIFGYILAIGPSTNQIIASLREADKWTSELQQHYRNELGDAHRENDQLMSSILEFSEEQFVSMCFSHVSNVRWPKPRTNMLEAIDDCVQVNREAKSRSGTSTKKQAQTASNDVRSPTKSNSHLFLIKNSYRGKTPWKMGVASSLAKAGDLVCGISGVSRALVLRVDLPEFSAPTFQIFGTALFTEDFGFHGNYTPGRLSEFSDGERLDIKMDAATLYVLLA